MEGFTYGVEVKVNDGTGRGRVALSPESGQFAFSCPAGASDLCNDSFVHDIHHYRLCPKDQYERMKEWGLDKYEDAEGGAAPAAGGADGAAHADPAAALHSDVADALHRSVTIPWSAAIDESH